MHWPTSQDVTRHPATIQVLWSVGFTLALAVAFAPQAWPLVDVYGFFDRAQSLDWPQTVADAFGRNREYRPLHVLLIKLLYHVAALRLWFYKALILLQFVAILGVLVWILEPVGWRRSVSVLVALCCVAGLPSSQILLALLPVNTYSLVTLLVLTTAAMALDPRMRVNGWVFLPLTLMGLLLLELAVLAPAVVTVLWLARSPGVGRTGVAASWMALIVYAGVRLSFGEHTDALQYTESGLGFADASRAQLGELFANAPSLFAIYNVAASTLTVLFSEPRAGKFKFIESLLNGNTPAWLWFHVVSSIGTTIAVASLVVLRKHCSTRDVRVVVLGLTLMAGGSALGFLYTRDRISVLVGIGYAMLLAVALSALWESAPHRGWRQLLAGSALVVLAGAWTIRDAETWLRVRDTAWETYVEWTDRYDTLGGLTRPQTPLLEHLRTTALANQPRDPRDDPSWTYLLFEREITR